MSGSSSVGNAAVYEAGDQRNAPASQKQDDQAERYEEGKEHSHKENDSSKISPMHAHKLSLREYNATRKLTKGTRWGRKTEDERSIANRLAAAHDQNDPNDGSGKKKTAEQIAGEHDPTAPAKMHGNEPSRGAKIDKAIEDEEAELLRRKDESQAAKKKNH